MDPLVTVYRPLLAALKAGNLEAIRTFRTALAMRDQGAYSTGYPRPAPPPATTGPRPPSRK